MGQGSLAPNPLKNCGNFISLIVTSSKEPKPASFARAPNVFVSPFSE